MKIRGNAWTAYVAVTAALMAGCSASDSPQMWSGGDAPAGNAGAANNAGAVDSPTNNGSAPNAADPNAAVVGANGSDPGANAATPDALTPSALATDANGNPVAPDAVAPPSDPATGGSTPAVCVPGTPKTSQIPRLTNAQYDNTTRDLLGLDMRPSSMLAPDGFGSVDQRTWDGYQNAAKSLAATVMADAAARAKVIPCTPTGDGTECATQFITTFGAKAFRRPLTADEVARYSLFYTQRAEAATFDETAQLLIEAFLSSPYFLSRSELTQTPEGDRFALSGNEVASRLSYLLWGSMPDDELFAAAAAGTLSTSDGILSQATRMLSDARAHAVIARFHEQYMHMGLGTRWETIERDSQLYPNFTQAMVPALSAEIEQYMDHVVYSNGSFQDLLTSPVAYVNADIAPLYGLNSADFGPELEPVELDATVRPGLLTRAGFLTANSNFNRTSPILRGAFIQKEVLCTSMGAPPANAASTPLPTDVATNRERVDAQTAPAECAGCHHTIVNPTGFALEGFDATGAVQTVDNGAPVNTVADVLVGSTVVPVTGAADLMTALANSPQAQRCYTKKLVEYAYDRSLDAADVCTVDDLAAKLTNSGYSVLNLITDLTQTDSFRYRALETEVAQ